MRIEEKLEEALRRKYGDSEEPRTLSERWNSVLDSLDDEDEIEDDDD